MQLFRSRDTSRPITAGVITGSDYKPPSSSRGLRVVAMCAFLIIISASASVFALTHQGSAPAPSSHPQPAVLSASTQAGPSSVTTPSSAAVAPSSAPRTATVPCARGSYGLPAAITAAGRSSGVYIQLDPSSGYQVHGSTPAEITSQLAVCTPVRSGGVFAANTGYSLSNYYTYGIGSDGLCHVTNAVVTLHVNQIFPVWSNTGASSATSTSRWNTFISSLRTHEQGHVDLDRAYSYKLYDAMQNIPPQSCSTIKSSVDNAAKSVMSDLATANVNYDTTTNHGTTQGAVL